MKFKVTKKEPLEKAMNKANLVLVEVPVITKKGQHRSHRWKRAIDALDQLFKDLGKKTNSKEITFIDKKTNKKINKDGLIKDYKKRGKQANKTLQAFVAENYKTIVGKANNMKKDENKSLRNKKDKVIIRKEDDKNFVNNTLSEKGQYNKQALQNTINNYKKTYKERKRLSTDPNEEEFLLSLKKDINALNKVIKREDNYFWECNDFTKLSKLGPEVLKDICELQPTFKKTEGLNETDVKRAYSIRSLLVMEYLSELSKQFGKGRYSTEEANAVKRTLKGNINPKFYLNTEDPTNEDYNFNNFVTQCKKQYDLEKDNEDYLLGLGGKRLNALFRFGTKKIEPEKEFKVSKDFSSFKSSLQKLKGFHTDTVARAAMDMAGINSDLYVKRNGNVFTSGKRKMLGYCRYAEDKVLEIGVVDNPENRKGSYKTTIHEVSHGLLLGTDAAKLPTKYNEGIVEMIGYTSTKLAYGKEYREGKDIRSYPKYVLETYLRLQQMPEFKNKSITNIGQALGDMAFRKDKIALDRISAHLLKSNNSISLINLVNKHKEFTIENIEREARKRHEDKKQPTEFEKTQLAMLVDKLKNGTLTLEAALNSDSYGEFAAILLYNILDEEDDELLGLF